MKNKHKFIRNLFIDILVIYIHDSIDVDSIYDEYKECMNDEFNKMKEDVSKDILGMESDAKVYTHGRSCILLIGEIKDNKNRYGLIVHELYHIMEYIKSTIREYNSDNEVYAYMVQQLFMDVI